MLKAPYTTRDGDVEPRCEFLTFLDDIGRMDMLRFRILLAVARKPHECASYYAEDLGVDPSALCKVVRTMSTDGHYRRPHMAQGVIERTPGVDRRTYSLSLTKRGRELLRRIRDEINQLPIGRRA